jgi:DNA repair exonuclease SbcCD nuclease subunit
MAKYLLYSDIHIHPHKNSLQRLDHCLQCLEWVFNVAIDQGIEDVIFLGDLFQDRQKIQILPYHKTYETIQRFAGRGLKMYMLIGNHDMWFADRCDISSVFPFNAIEGVTVIAKPTTISIAGTDIDFLPYTKNPLESMKVFTKPSRLLMGHVSIDGAKLNTFRNRIADISVEHEGDMVPVDSSQFKSWERVFLGHFHASQRLDNVEYVGSPLQLNFAEAFQQKRVMVLDSESLETTDIVNEFSPKHYILSPKEVDQYDLENAFVVLEPDDISSADILDIQKYIIEEKKASSVETSASTGVLNEQQEIDEAKSIVLSKDKFAMIDNYVDHVDCGGLEKSLVSQIGKGIIEKSQVN